VINQKKTLKKTKGQDEWRRNILFSFLHKHVTGFVVFGVERVVVVSGD